MQHVFIVGSKSLGAYGGYETFVYKLTEYNRNSKDLKFHVMNDVISDVILAYS